MQPQNKASSEAWWHWGSCGHCKYGAGADLSSDPQCWHPGSELATATYPQKRRHAHTKDRYIYYFPSSALEFASCRALRSFTSHPEIAPGKSHRLKRSVLIMSEIHGGAGKEKDRAKSFCAAHGTAQSQCAAKILQQNPVRKYKRLSDSC